MVKCMPTMQETQVRSLSQEDPLEKEMTTLTWETPWMEEAGIGYSLWGCKESDMTEQLHFHFLSALQRGSPVPFFYFHIWVNKRYLFLSFWLHSVWHSLGLSTSPQTLFMKAHFHSFLWLSNILLYMCATSLNVHQQRSDKLFPMSWLL